MTDINSAVRNLLSEIDSFFSETLRTEKVSKKTTLHKEKILDLIFRLRQEFPDLLPKVSEFTRNDDEFIPDLAARELRDITKAGFLEKRRKKETLFPRGSYQRRYCVIQKGIFYYYIHPTDKKQAGAFNLRGYKFRKAPYLPVDGTKKDLSFEIVCAGKRSYQFLAEITQDFKEWKEAIEKCCGDKNNMKSKDSSYERDIDDDDAYYIAVKNDDEIPRASDNDDEFYDGENYEPFNMHQQDRNGNTNIDKSKKPILPKKPAQIPKKKSQSSRAPLKPPILPKNGVRGDKVVTDDDDDDYDDDDYTDPTDYGRYSDEFDEEYDDVVSSRKPDQTYRKASDRVESEELYYADASSSRPRTEVTSDIYQDAASAPRK